MKTLIILIALTAFISAFERPLPMGDRFLGFQLSVGDTGSMFSSLVTSHRSGGSVATLDMAWDDVEDTLGNLKDPNLQIKYANIMYKYYPMKVIVILSSLDTDTSRVPKQLKNRPLQDSVVVAHYLRAAEYVLAGLPDVEVHAFVIGNETDNYLKSRPAKWPEYKAFYGKVADSLRARHPSIKIANKNTWFGLKYYNRSDVIELNLKSDLIFVNYYMLDTMFQVVNPVKLHTDFDTLCALFPAKKIYISEFGCPSADSFVNGSEDLQRQFVVESFKAWDSHADQIKCFYYFWLNDISQRDLDMFAAWYGNSAPWFMAWLGTMGFIARDGREKPAFHAYREEFEARTDTVKAILPKNRSFKMGFTPWPYNNTVEAVNNGYDSILANSDMISEHIDEGVPWTECYNNLPFPKSFSDDLNFKLDKIKNSGSSVFLSLNPLNLERSGLAGYRNNAISQPLPPEWSTKAFDSDSVKRAFLNYSRKMVELFKPEWVAIGIEVNLLMSKNRGEWSKFVSLRKYVYDSLKVSHPAIKVGVTFVGTPFYPQWSSGDTLANQLKALRDVEPSSDFIAFSIYPYMSAILCDSLPADYVSHLFSLTSKPVAISECGYSAQTWSAHGNIFRGTVKRQNAFLSSVLQACAARNALFAVWFTAFDFDSLWVNALGRDSLSLIWRDCGLLDDMGNPRNGWETWKDWLALKAATDAEGLSVISGAEMVAAPNPFNPTTKISIPYIRSSEGSLRIYNQQGKIVREIAVGALDRSVTWNGRDNFGRSLASGIYLAVFDCQTKKKAVPLFLVR
ncbi:MAG: hypothetical protein JNL74_07480 [Fibrobacteres bacterium]|nr:hypothetical protein [Fibrobacterota bacterium]